MSRRGGALALGLALVTRAASAEPAPDHVELEAQAHFGVSTTPFDAPLLPQAKGQAFVFVTAARYTFADRLSLELRFPFVLGSVAQPAGSYVDAGALGNPQAGARYQFLQRRTEPSLLVVSGAVDFGLPLATHADDLMPNRVLAIGDGIEGRRHPEWFTPGVFPITPSTLLRWVSAPWNVQAELRLPLLVRISEASLPVTPASTRAVGFAAVLGGEGQYRLSRRLSLAAAATFFLDIVPPVKHEPDVSRVQDFERVGVLVHFGATTVLAVDLQTAIGGELGGSTVGGGLRAIVNLR